MRMVDFCCLIVSVCVISCVSCDLYECSFENISINSENECSTHCISHKSQSSEQK